MSFVFPGGFLELEKNIKSGVFIPELETKKGQNYSWPYIL